jgi:DNA-binding transcriptional regulator GbsR (MarR family)
MIRRGILFTDDDEMVLSRLKEKLRVSQGVVSLTAIIRLAIRKLQCDLDASTRCRKAK